MMWLTSGNAAPATSQSDHDEEDDPDDFSQRIDPELKLVEIDDGRYLTTYGSSSVSIRTSGSVRTDGNNSVRSKKPRDRQTQKDMEDTFEKAKFAMFLDATRMDYVQMGPNFEDNNDKGRADFAEQQIKIEGRYKQMYGSSAPKIPPLWLDSVHPSLTPLMRGENKGIRVRT
jgi:hypothetical protein